MLLETSNPPHQAPGGCASRGCSFGPTPWGEHRGAGLRGHATSPARCGRRMVEKAIFPRVNNAHMPVAARAAGPIPAAMARNK